YVATNNGLAIGTKSAQGWGFRLVPPAPGHSAGEEAASVYVDSRGTVWVGCGLKSLCRLQSDKAVDAGTNEGLPSDHWEALREDLEGDLWVRSEHHLAVLPNGARRFQVRNGVEPATNTFPTLALDPQGRLLVPTNEGLARELRSSDGKTSGWEIIG